VASCRLCGQTIRFDKEFKSEYTGKLIPLDENEEVDEPHNCLEWEAQNRRYYPCRTCDAPIYFDDKRLSKNGKYIPLSKTTGEPHQCDDTETEQKLRVQYSQALELLNRPMDPGLSQDAQQKLKLMREQRVKTLGEQLAKFN
jgi:hypothetical protein